MKIKSIVIAASLALGMVGMASGATIIWSNSIAATEGDWGQELSAGLFSTNGAQVYAENVGGDAYTFDSIAFEAGTTVFAGTTNVYHDEPDNWETELSATGTSGTNGADTVTLTGLTPGTNYVIQALIFDGRNVDVEPTSPGRTIEVDGTDYGTYAAGEFNVTWGEGLLLTGTFTADATTQAFTLEAFNGGTSYGGQLNALTVFDPNGFVEPPPPVATITWTSELTPMEGSFLEILSAGLFDTNGTKVLAENIGGDALTWDGIDFTDGHKGVGTVDFFGDDPGPLAEPSQALITVGQYSNPGGLSPVTLSGLTIGLEYRIQALVYDSRSFSVGRAVRFDGQDMGVYGNSNTGVDYGPGLLVTGTFTATATSQPFLLEVFADNTYTTSKGQTLNALTLYAVTPPESAFISIAGPISGGTAMEISWTNQVGYSFSVHTNSNLVIPNWGSMTSGVSGVGAIITITSPISEDQLFYRVITE